MFFMLFTSISLIVLLLAAPIVWLVLTAIAAACVCMKLYKDRFQTSSAAKPSITRLAVEAAVLAIIPLSILAYGLIHWLRWESEPRHIDEAHLLHVLDVAVYFQVIPLGWFIWRHTDRPWISAPIGMAFALWTLAAQFASTMAITGNWL